jgi:FkbH-like protein
MFSNFKTEKLIEANLDSKTKQELSIRLVETKIEFLLERDCFSNAGDLLLEASPLLESNSSLKLKARSICGILLEKLSQTNSPKAHNLINKLPHWILEDSTVQSSIGKVFASLGDINEAERHFERAINIDPENANVLLNLASLFEAKKPQKSFIHYQDFFRKSSDPSAAKIFSKKVKKLLSNNRQGISLKPIKIAIIGNITLQPLRPFLEAQCFLTGIQAEFFFGSYDFFTQEIINPNSELYQFAPNITFLLLDATTFIPELFDTFFEIDPELRLPLCREKFDRMRSLSNTFLDHSQSALAISNFSLPRHFIMGIHDHRETPGEKEILDTWNRWLSDHVKTKPNGLYLLDVEKAISHSGKTFDDKMKYLAKMSIPESAFPTLAKEMNRIVSPIAGLSKKCLVLDLDNTLWGGVLGEDGIEGVKIDTEPPGNAYRDFQNIIKALLKRGIILAINSKNDIELVQEAFEKRPEMILKLSDFSCIRANWQDKAQNMREIAAELNIGLDSFVFMDDNPAERFLIKRELPEVLTIDLPNDCSNYAQALLEIDVFETLNITSEDKNRTQMYQAETERKQLKTQTTNLSEYLTSLETKVEVLPVDSFSIPRVSQLTQRTNQFNLTTRRYSEAEIKSFSHSKDSKAYCIKSSDRFGDHGTVGACIVKTTSKTSWELDVLLMSCRALGRGIEEAFMNFICEEAKKAAIQTLVGRYMPTKKNGMAKDFYKRLRFKQVSTSKQETVYQFPLKNHCIPLPSYVRLNASI